MLGLGRSPRRINHGSRSDRHIRLALRFLAGTFLPRGPSYKGAAPILRQPVRSGRTQWRVLPNAHAGCRKSWKEQTGKDFVFTWKASKFITHWKRLSANSVNSLELMEDRLSLLGDKAGPGSFSIAAQLPGRCGSPIRLSSYAVAGKTLQFRIPPPQLVFATDHAPALRSKTYRFAFPTTMTRRRLGNGRRTSSMFEVMVRAVATRDTIRRVPWRIGPSASSRGNRKGATCSCSSITIRRAPHRSMP